MANLLIRSFNGRGLHAPVRVDTRTKRLVTRLRPGDIAIIDHVDLDGPAAEALVACRASAVVNAAASISGRYPNRGPGGAARRRHPVDRRGRAARCWSKSSKAKS